MNQSVFALLLAAQLLAGCGAAGAQGNNNTGRMMESAIHQSAAMESTAAKLTREQAEAIALEHAGFTADQVSRLRTEFEIDDGVPRFEVQFRQGRWEYDYEINANTGELLSYDRDD